MEKVIGVALMAAALLLGAQIASSLDAVSSTTAPAFLWSPHLHGSTDKGVKEAVNYQIISPKDLAKSVMIEGGWGNLLCSGKDLQQNLDVALVFVGNELHSSDVSRNKNTDPALLDMLRGSFTKSNFSMAFPYVAVSEETIEGSLLSGFTETCGEGLEITNVSFLESCLVEDDKFQKLADVRSVRDYLVSRMDKRLNGHADLVVFCNGGASVDEQRSESQILSELISSIEQAGVKYAMLYASNPVRLIQYPSYRDLERFLAEGSVGNGSTNSTTCDEVCQIKSSLLEGLLVAIVLLIILISGLCCMMGIDTPTRFEAPQES